MTWTEGTKVVAQIVDSQGKPIAGKDAFIIDDTSAKTPEVSALPKVGDEEGGFIIAWASDSNIYVQKFDANGTKLSDNPIEVEAGNAASSEPSVTTLTDGGYVISWHDASGVHTRRFTADGEDYRQTSFDMDEDTSITISVSELLSNDSDPQGNQFKLISVQNPTHGSVVANDTDNDGVYDTVTYTPDANYAGEATFEYTIEDIYGAQDTATVNMLVKEVGEATVSVGALCDADIKGSDVFVDEGRDAKFVVRVGGAETGSTITLALADGSATTQDDYNNQYFEYSIDKGATWEAVPADGKITGVENGTVILVKTDTVGDNVDDSNETFTLTATLSGPNAQVLSTSTSTATIIEAAPKLSIDNQSIVEQDGQMTFTVTLDGHTTQETTVNWETIGGTSENWQTNNTTATENGDFTKASGTLTFAPGETSKTITIDIKDDSYKE